MKVHKSKLSKWVAVFGLVLAPVLAAQPERDSYEVPVTVCGLSFKITRDWVASPGKTDSKGVCSAELKSRDYERHG